MHIQRQRDTFSWRFAAFNQEFVDGLKREFYDWHKQQPRGSIFGGGMIGGLDHWPNIENFLKEKYPAAHKGFDMGYEQAGSALDYPNARGGGGGYETGPEAMAQYGYDPKEIAAGMLLLHNKTDRFRGDLSQGDQQRLVDIFHKRQQMQREYENRQGQQWNPVQHKETTASHRTAGANGDLPPGMTMR